MGAMIGSGMLCQALPYHEGFGAKQIAWLVHSAVVGSVVAPLTLLGGPLMIRAACYTAGVVGGNATSSFLLLSLSVWVDYVSVATTCRQCHTSFKPKFHLLHLVTTRYLAHAFWYRKKSYELCHACCTASATQQVTTCLLS